MIQIKDMETIKKNGKIEKEKETYLMKTYIRVL